MCLGIVTIDKFTNTFTPHPSVIYVPKLQPLLPYGKAIVHLRKCPSFPVHWTLVPSYVPRLQVASLVYVLLVVNYFCIVPVNVVVVFDSMQYIKWILGCHMVKQTFLSHFICSYLRILMFFFSSLLCCSHKSG